MLIVGRSLRFYNWSKALKFHNPSFWKKTNLSRIPARNPFSTATHCEQRYQGFFRTFRGHPKRREGLADYIHKQREFSLALLFGDEADQLLGSQNAFSTSL